MSQIVVVSNYNEDLTKGLLFQGIIQTDNQGNITLSSHIPKHIQSNSSVLSLRLPIPPAIELNQSIVLFSKKFKRKVSKGYYLYHLPKPNADIHTFLTHTRARKFIHHKI